MVESKGTSSTSTATTAAPPSAARPPAGHAPFPKVTRPLAGTLSAKGAARTTVGPRAGDAARTQPRAVNGAALGDGTRGGRQSSSARPLPERDARGDADPLDPIFRQRELLAPPHAIEIAPPPPMAPPIIEPTAPAQTAARASLEEVLPAIVRKIAWSGDGKKGAVRLEFGAGALAGATLLVESDEGRVRVRLSAPAGVDAEAWKQRIGERLAARRIAVDGVEVE